MTNPNTEFQINSGKVFDAPILVMRETAAWAYVKPFAKKHDDHGVITALYNHYLGPINVNNQASAAEHVLNMTTHTGETQHWNFEKYATLYKKQHGILECLVEHGYKGINEGTKVCHLMDGIKTTKLDAVCALINANATLKKDFDLVVAGPLHRFYQSGGGKKAPTCMIVELSATKTDDIEDCYYPPAEYNKLLNSRKEVLKRRHKAWGHIPASQDSRQQCS
jgi:hypothetical protein